MKRCVHVYGVLCLIIAYWFLFTAFIVLPSTDYTLTIYAGEKSYTFRYPEIDFKKGNLYLKNQEEIIERISLDTRKNSIDATVSFHPLEQTKFSFTKETTGKQIDKEFLSRQINLALESKSPSITARFLPLKPKILLEQLEKQTVLRAQFQTDYSGSTNNRKHNINLACLAINGTFLNPNGVFSFNEIVGARTEERGYRLAKIILQGTFSDGVGGGVCQVSTTLYNCALLSGLEILERHPHSLSVSYIEPSFDAMVSFYNDLKFKNTTDGLIFIESFADGNKVTFRIYGFEQTANITRISTVESTECPGYDEVEDIDGSICGEVEEKILVSSKPIIKSKSSLIINENGKTFKRHLSNDTYKGVKGVKAKKSTISHINNE